MNANTFSFKEKQQQITGNYSKSFDIVHWYFW